MADPHDSRDADQTGQVGSRPVLPAGPPPWVKVIGIVGLVLIMLFATLLVTNSGGDHGPGRHTGGRDMVPANSIARTGAPVIAGGAPGDDISSSRSRGHG